MLRPVVAARVDLVDPGPEGASLAGGLRAAGFQVEVRAISEVPATRADAVVLAGDLEGALDAIRRLRDDGASPDTPVVLLGTPPGTSHRGAGPGFGAQAVLSRPIVLGSLIDTLEHVLAPPQSVVSASRQAPRRERTMQLDRAPSTESSEVVIRREPPIPETGADPLRHVEDLAAAAPSRVRTPVGEPPSSSERSSSGAVRATASISDRLRDLLHAADRRAFPGRPSIDLSLPGGDEPASELVPAELLEHDDLGLELVPADEDAIDAFTFVGGPVLPPSAQGEARGEARPPSVAPPPPEEPANHKKTSPGTPTSLSRRPPARTTQAPISDRPLGLRPSSRPPVSRAPVQRPPGDLLEQPAEGTGVQEARVRPSTAAPRMPSEWPSEDSVLGRVAPDGGRRGTLAAFGALRLLLRIVELRLDARVSITPAQGETVTLVAVGGELASLEGPEATRAITRLRQRDRALPTAASELAARRVLDDAVARGALTALERDRALREGREVLIRELVLASRATFSLARFEGDELPPRTASPLGAPLAAAIVEAARRAIGPAEARELLGGAVELRRGPRFDAFAADGVIAPELVALFERHEGESDARVIDQAADEPGMPGLVCALVAARALLASPIAAPDPAPRERARVARRLIEDAARLAEEGDYFAILGVAQDASDRDVLHTHRRRVEALASLPLEELDLGELAAARSAALEALDEAHRILSVARWRAAYAAALRGSQVPSQGAGTTAGSHDGASPPQLASPSPEH